MTTRFASLLALLLLLPARLSFAQAPSGIIEFSFDNQTAPVWDLSGQVTFEQTMLGAANSESPLAFSLQVTQDAKGVLSSSGATLVQVGENDFVGATVSLRGKVSGGGNKPSRASMNVLLTGEDIVAGVNTQFKINIHYTLEASTDDLAFIGRASGNASFRELSSAKIKTDVTVPMPGGMDGSWTARLNIIPLQKLGGSGTIILSNGRELPTTLKGSYSGKTALANVKLNGTGEGIGTSLNLKFISSEDGIELQSAKGKIVGQSVRTEAATP